MIRWCSVIRRTVSEWAPRSRAVRLRLLSRLSDREPLWRKRLLWSLEISEGKSLPGKTEPKPVPVGTCQSCRLPLFENHEHCKSPSCPWLECSCGHVQNKEKTK